MPKSSSTEFAAFRKFFPEIDLPITLTDESILEFNKHNKPLAQVLIEKVIVPIEGNNIDEYTEFVPCLQLPPTEDYFAIIYWKGMLLSYEYVLATFEKSGQLISRKIIAGTRVEDDKVIKSVCNIDEDQIIHIIVGGQEADAKYDGQSSQAMSMEILSSGDIIFSLQEQ